MLPKLQRAHEAPGDLIRMQFLIQEVWGRIRDSAFLQAPEDANGSWPGDQTLK